jgi:predicted nuclease of predicted toxin-antitoxin system
MKFLVDAHLPKRLARLLQQLGYDAIHTLDLPEQNRTDDTTIIQIAIASERIVVTKDSDFSNSFWLVHKPPQLLLVSTGNIATLAIGFQTYDYIELSRQHIIYHS